MEERQPYRTVPLKDITRALAEQVRALFERDPTIKRSLTTNAIVLSPYGEPSALIDRRLELLTSYAPGRYFVVSINSEPRAIEASIRVVTHRLSRSEQICSELVFLRACDSQLEPLISLIRSNLATGLPVETLYLGKLQLDAVFEALLGVTDDLVFDSAALEGATKGLGALTQIKPRLVDLQWVGLSIVREDIARIFGQPAIKAAAPLHALEIAARGTGEARHRIPALLLAGWILNVLKVSSIVYGSDGFRCGGGYCPSEFTLRLTDGGAAPASILSAVNFDFEGGASAGIEVGAAQQTVTVRSPEASRSSRPADDASESGRLRRYYLLGNGDDHYRPALRTALVLEELSRGFESGSARG